MLPKDALALLGATRVIWIDDRFDKSKSVLELADLLANHVEIARTFGIESLRSALECDEEDTNARQGIVDSLEKVTEEERGQIEERMRAALASQPEAGETEDFNDSQIEEVCSQLNIATADRWSFEGAENKIDALSKDDTSISYIIDLNDGRGGGGATRGLDLIKLLVNKKSKSTAFILTHAATKDDESSHEQQLFASLKQDVNGHAAPPCVIAKERLEGGLTSDKVAAGLLIAIKRAGLRKSLFEVLIAVEDRAAAALEAARNALLGVVPEALDNYVVENAYREGVSELHVVERALTASVSQNFRREFATNKHIQECASRLRALHEIPLDTSSTTADKVLQEFRDKELWEPDDIVNAGFSPLACGDVFAYDKDEYSNGNDTLFVLLVQPCDVMLRPNTGRACETGFLAPMKISEEGDKTSTGKKPVLAYMLQGKRRKCEFRDTATVNLNILDLCTLRQDGKVLYEFSQVVHKNLLPGQIAAATEFQKKLVNAIEATKKKTTELSQHDTRWQLALTSNPKSPIKNIAYGIHKAASHNTNKARPERLTWNLRRIGRLRWPYAVDLLHRYLSDLGREAFDLEYMRHEPSEPKATAQPAQPAQPSQAAAETAAA